MEKQKNNDKIEKNKRIEEISSLLLKQILLLALLSSMILSFYLKVDNLLCYNLGLTLLKISIIFYTSIQINQIAFKRILNEFH